MSDFNLQTKGLFGRYCRIEMFRYGVPNEFYIHKIVSQNRTNTYCDVPLKWDSKPERHPEKDGLFPDNLEEVIWVVQCGIDETKVFPVALKDVELLGEDFNEGCEFQKVGSDGYPFCASATEIMRLRDDLQRANAENAKLREEFDKMDVWHSKELSAAMAENAKLRELVRDYERCTMHADCSRCEYDGKLSTHCPLSPCFPDTDKLDEMVDAAGQADDIESFFNDVVNDKFELVRKEGEYVQRF